MQLVESSYSSSHSRSCEFGVERKTATATKSRPGQSFGLELEERNNENDDHNSIYIASVSGLFEEGGADIQIGDRLVDINNISVYDKNEFPNGEKSTETDRESLCSAKK